MRYRKDKSGMREHGNGMQENEGGKKRITEVELYEAIGGVEDDLLERSEELDAGGKSLRDSARQDTLRVYSSQNPQSDFPPHEETDTQQEGSGTPFGPFDKLGDRSGVPDPKRRKQARLISRYLPLVAMFLVLLGVAALWRASKDSMGSTATLAPAEEAALDMPEEAEEDVALEEAGETSAPELVEGSEVDEAYAMEEDAGPSTTSTGSVTGAGTAAVNDTADGIIGSVREESVENARAEAADESKEATKQVMRIRVSDGTNTIIFKLNDSATAMSLYAQLPFDVPVSNYSSNEKIFTPPAALEETGGIEGGGHAGGIAYFSPWGNIAMYYDDFSRYPGLYLLGEAEEGADAIRSLSGTLHIEAAE